MNPDTYRTLYGPWRPAVRRRGTGTAVLAGVLWAVALQVIACLAFLSAWAAADRGPTDGFPVTWLVIGLAIAAVPIGLVRTPAVRRLTVPGRALVTGLAMCLIALGLVVRACLQI